MGVTPAPPPRRSAPVQEGPPPDLTGIPTGNVPRTPWFREHQRRPGPDGGCWYFATLPTDPHHESGRFDLPAPDGTCYFGNSDRVAAMERVGRFTAAHQPVPADFVDGRVVTTADSAVMPPNAADLAAPDAGTQGVTGELFAMSDYPVPQRWARALHAAGHHAILYTPRFTPGGQALAIFGPAGARPGPIIRHTPLREVLEDIGVTVAPIPGTTGLIIVDP